jgi:hypothetical protein
MAEFGMVEAIVPLPLPDLVTDSVNVLRVKVAVTFFTVSIVTEQMPVPEHAPDQLVKLDVGSGVAVSVTAVPNGNNALQLGTPQLLIPVGLEETVPAPGT